MNRRLKLVARPDSISRVTVRNPLACIACGVIIVTRTAVGFRDSQTYTFNCPKCGIAISYVFRTDQKNISFSYDEPANAKWVDSEEGAVATLSFDAHTPVPTDLPDGITPFIATVHNIENLKAYTDEERKRVMWIRDGWSYSERLMVHLERGNDELFDQEAGTAPAEKPASRVERLAPLLRAIEGAFNYFTVTKRSARSIVEQRIALSQSIAEPLFEEFAREYLDSGRLSSIWQQMKMIRRKFVQCYPYLSPLVQMLYWKSAYQDLSTVRLSEKRFDELRQLYVDCYETLCKLLTIAMACEAIIHHGGLVVPTRKRQLSLWDFEALPNGQKPNILYHYPIAPLFASVLDSKLRNGIGHHSAHFVPEADEVVYYEFEGAEKLERRVSYTMFVQRVLEIFSAVELASKYLRAVLMSVNGLLQ